MINLCLYFYGDFNAEEWEPSLSQFVYEYNAKNIVKENTCFKNALNRSSIDLFVTNCPLSFQNTIAIFNGLSGFHKMVITVINVSFKKHSPIGRHYKDYKYFDQTKFKNNLNEKLNESISNYESFKNTFTEVLNRYAPSRKKILRVNHALYIAKTLRKAIMRRSQLETKYLKKRERRKYYEPLDRKNVLDSKEFWKILSETQFFCRLA